MMRIIRIRATSEEVEDMLEALGIYIKLAVDIQRRILAGGGEKHYDCEQLLLQDDSNQIDIWSANWVPLTQSIEFESLINIRPKRNNSMIILDPEIQAQVTSVVQNLLGDV